jgi:hypothetical protein
MSELRRKKRYCTQPCADCGAYRRGGIMRSTCPAGEFMDLPAVLFPPWLLYAAMVLLACCWVLPPPAWLAHADAVPAMPGWALASCCWACG